MSEPTEVLVPSVEAPVVKPTNLTDGVRQLPYAWAGLWSIAVEELGNFYQRCVARGEQLLNGPPAATQPEVKRLDSDVNQKQLKATAPRTIRPTTIMNMFGAVESYHVDLNVDKLLPTKEDLNALAERVEMLNREVDALVEQRKAELPGSQE